MNEAAPAKKSGLGPIILALVMFAVGFAAGHIVADMGLLKTSSPHLPEPKQGSGTSTSNTRDGYPIDTEEAEQAAEDAQQEYEPELGQIDNRGKNSSQESDEDATSTDDPEQSEDDGSN